eukprot:PhM_4_TR5395/c0_g1_i1/m.84092
MALQNTTTLPLTKTATLTTVVVLLVLLSTDITTPVSAADRRRPQFYAYRATMDPAVPEYGQFFRLKLLTSLPNFINRTMGQTTVALIPQKNVDTGATLFCNTSLPKHRVQVRSYLNSRAHNAYEVEHAMPYGVEAYTTFYAPPFPFRICVRHNATNVWVSVTNVEPGVRANATASRVHWSLSTGEYSAGSWVSMKLQSTSYAFHYTKDNVKLVPYRGTPSEWLCLRDQPGEIYPGTQSSSSGEWTSPASSFIDYNAVIGTVAKLGDTTTQSIAAQPSAHPYTMYAHFRLPTTTGNYAVCYSSFYERAAFPSGRPGWRFVRSLSCLGRAPCPTNSYITVTAQAKPITMSSLDLREATYAALRFTGTGLNSYPSVGDLYATSGGDRFKIVYASEVTPTSTSATDGCFSTTTFGTAYTTSSTDLGTDPYDVSVGAPRFPWLQDRTNVLETWGFIRVPYGVASPLAVCYRMAGRNWQVVTPSSWWPTRNRASNTSYSFNDTRAGIFGMLTVTSTRAELSTMPTLWAGGVPDSVQTKDHAVGVKIVVAGRDCQTSAAEDQTEVLDVGSAEVLPWMPGASYFGHARRTRLESVPELRRFVVAYVRTPVRTAQSYQVCFRRGKGNWEIIGSTFTPKHAPIMTYKLLDVRAGTLGEILVTSTRTPLNARPVSQGGDIIKITYNTSGCDYTALNSNKDISILDLGSYNSNTGATDSLSDATGLGGVVAYTTLPPAPVSPHDRFIVCYRFASGQWVNLDKLQGTKGIRTTRAPTVSFTVSNPIGGAVGYVDFAMQSEDTRFDVSASGDQFRIVDATQRCDRPALDRAYTLDLTEPPRSFTNNSQNASTIVARAYLPFPRVFRGSVQRTRFCYKNKVYANWIELNPVVPVYTLNVRYRPATRPTHNTDVRIYLFAEGDVRLNTTRGGDRIRLIAHDQFCMDSTPAIAETSDLLPGEAVGQVDAYAELHLPPAATTVQYRVCYLSVGKQWVELSEYEGTTSFSVYRRPASEGEFTVFPSPITGATFDSRVLHSTGAVISGVYSAIGGEYMLSLEGSSVDYTRDRFKMVRDFETCADEAFSGTFASHAAGNFISGRFTGRVTHPLIHMPLVPGSYKMCYFSGVANTVVWSPVDLLGQWVSIPSSNFTVVDNQLRFEVSAATKLPEMIDAYFNTTYDSVPSLVASRVTEISDMIKLVAMKPGANCGSSDMTGAATATPVLPVDTFGEVDTIRSLSRIASVSAVPTAAGSYLVCLYKRESSPLVKAGLWVQARHLRGDMYYDNSAAAAISFLHTPIYNVSSGAPSGRPLAFELEIVTADKTRSYNYSGDVTVTVVDSDRKTALFSIVTPHGCHTGDIPRFQPGAASNNLVPVEFGHGRFSLFINDACGTFGCTVQVSATGLSSVSYVVGTRVERTMEIISDPNGEAALGLMNANTAVYVSIDWFSIELYAQTFSGLRNLGSRVAVLLTPNVNVNQIQCVLEDNSTCANGPEQFRIVLGSGGRGAFRMRFLSVGSITFRINIDPTTNGGVTGTPITRTVTVKSLLTRRVAIADIQPTQSMPTRAWFSTSVLPLESVVSAPGTYLQKGTSYTVYLQPMNEDGRVIPRSFVVTDVKTTVVEVSSVSYDDTRGLVAAVVTPTYACGSFDDMNPTSTASLCDVTFSIGDARATLKTAVRAVATRLRWELNVPVLTTAPGQPIPFSTLWAVDNAGERDYFNSAMIHPLMEGGNGVTNDFGVNLTIALGSNRTTTRKAMMNGAVLFNDLTLTKPCYGADVCRLTMHSSWGETFIVSPQVRALDTTHHLTGSIASPTGSRLVVNELYTVTLQAVDAEGRATAHDSSWIVAFLLQPTGPLAPAIEVVGGRYQPLSASRLQMQVRFKNACSNCKLRFVARAQTGFWTDIAANAMWETDVLIVTSTVNAIKLELESVNSALTPVPGFTVTPGNGTNPATHWYVAQVGSEFVINIKATDSNGLLATGSTARYPVTVVKTDTNRVGDGDGGNLTAIPATASTTLLNNGRASFVLRIDKPCLRCVLTFQVDRFDIRGYLAVWVSITTVATKLQLSPLSSIPSKLDPFTSYGTGEWTGPVTMEAVDDNGIVDFLTPFDVVMSQTGGLGGRQSFYCYDTTPCKGLDVGVDATEITRTTVVQSLMDQVANPIGGRAVFNFAGRLGDITRVVFKFYTNSKTSRGEPVQGYQAVSETNWTSTRSPRRFVILGTTTGLGLGWPVDSVNGYVSLSSRPAFNYSLPGTVFVGAAFPITVQVHDYLGRRVPTVSGTVKVEYLRHDGCGTGLPMQLQQNADTKTMKAGNVTFWIEFLSPCEKCYLRFSYAGDAAIIESTRVQTTLPIQVNSFQANKVVLRTAGTAPLPWRITDANELSLTFDAVAFIGGVAYSDKSLSGKSITVYAFSEFHPAESTNGGMFIVNNGSTSVRYAVATFVNGVAKVGVRFTRSCRFCRLYARSPFAGQPDFLLRNSNPSGRHTFEVHTEFSEVVQRNVVPTTVARRTDFDVILWQVDKYGDQYFWEDVDVTILLSRELGGGNGDGGMFRHTNIPLNVSYIQSKWALGSQVWRMQWGGACDACAFKLGQFSITQTVTTTATRVVIVDANVKDGAQILAGDIVTFRLELWDDNANIDRTVPYAQWYPMVVNVSASPTAFTAINSRYGLGLPYIVNDSYSFTNGVAENVRVRFPEAMQLSYVCFTLTQHPKKLNNLAVPYQHWLPPMRLGVLPALSNTTTPKYTMRASASKTTVMDNEMFTVDVSLWSNASSNAVALVEVRDELNVNVSVTGEYCYGAILAQHLYNHSAATVTLPYKVVLPPRNRVPTRQLLFPCTITVLINRTSANETQCVDIPITVTMLSAGQRSPSPLYSNYLANTEDTLALQMVDGAGNVDYALSSYYNITLNLTLTVASNLACPVAFVSSAPVERGVARFSVVFRAGSVGLCQFRVISSDPALVRDSSLVTIRVQRPAMLRFTTNLTSVLNTRLIAGETYTLRANILDATEAVVAGDRRSTVRLVAKLSSNNPSVTPVPSIDVATQQFMLPGPIVVNSTDGTFVFTFRLAKPTPVGTVLQLGLVGTNPSIDKPLAADWTDQVEVITVATRLVASYPSHNSAASKQTLNVLVQAQDALGNVASQRTHIGHDSYASLITVWNTQSNVTHFIDISKQGGNNLNTIRMASGEARFALNYVGPAGKLELRAKAPTLAYKNVDVFYQAVSHFTVDSNAVSGFPTPVVRLYTLTVNFRTIDTLGEPMLGDNSTWFNISSTGPAGNIVASDAQPLNRSSVNGVCTFTINFPSYGRGNAVTVVMRNGAVQLTRVYVVNVAASAGDLNNMKGSFQPRKLTMEVGAYPTLEEFNATAFATMIANATGYAKPQHVVLDRVCHANDIGKMGSECLNLTATLVVRRGAEARRSAHALETTTAVLAEFHLAVPTADIPAGFDPNGLDYAMVDAILAAAQKAKDDNVGPLAALKPGSVLLSSDPAASPQQTAAPPTVPPGTTAGPATLSPGDTPAPTPWWGNGTVSGGTRVVSVGGATTTVLSAVLLSVLTSLVFLFAETSTITL